MKVQMKALRDFPLGEESRRIVEKGEEFEVNSSEIAFFEETNRARRVNPEPESKPAKSKEA